MLLLAAIICASAAGIGVWSMRHAETRGLRVDRSGIISFTDSAPWKRITPLEWRFVADISLDKSVVHVILADDAPVLNTLRMRDRAVLTSRGCGIRAQAFGIQPEVLFSDLTTIWRAWQQPVSSTKSAAAGTATVGKGENPPVQADATVAVARPRWGGLAGAPRKAVVAVMSVAALPLVAAVCVVAWFFLR
jgi:hypothetical protein